MLARAFFSLILLVEEARYRIDVSNLELLSRLPGDATSGLPQSQVRVDACSLWADLHLARVLILLACFTKAKDRSRWPTWFVACDVSGSDAHEDLGSFFPTGQGVHGLKW